MNTSAEEKISKNSNVYKSFKKIARELYLKNFEIYKERRRLHEILTQVGEVIFAVDKNYKITLFNLSAYNLFGLKGGEVVGRDVDDVIKLTLADKENTVFSARDFCFKKSVEEAFLKKGIETPVPLIYKQGENVIVYLKINFTNIEIASDKNSKECVVSLSNVTNEVVIDKQKDEFISIASHELKTPISIIKSNFWMFKYLTENKIEKDLDKYIKEMDYGIDRLSKIINNLLDISRIEQGRFVIEETLFNFDELIKECVLNFKDLALQKKLKLISPKTKVGKLVADRERLREVIDNFISNAIKYTEKGGISLFIEISKEYLKVIITDTGPGIEERDMGRLFKKFSRASEGLKQEKPGASTGLGLYISKRIVEEMGGHVGVLSKPGKGSSFWFTIPVKLSLKNV